MAPRIIRAATLALRAATSICPASPVCPQDDQCALTANGVSLQISCGTDFYGGDLQLAHTSTLAGCMKACSATEGCVAASYVDQNCYLKNTLMDARENANVIGVAITAREASTPSTPSTPKVQEKCPSNFACPDNDGCIYTGGSRTLELTCGADFYGGDLDNQWSETVQDCAEACATNEQCVAASFVGGRGSGRCYLKSTNNGANINDNVDAFHLVATPSPPEPATPKVPVIPTAPLLKSCGEIESPRNVLSNGGFEQIGKNGALPIAPWTSSIADDVYGHTYKPGAHCGERYITMAAHVGSSAITTQKIPSALDTAKYYAASIFIHTRSLPAPTVCQVEMFANDVRISSIDLTTVDTADFKTGYVYKGFVSDPFIPKSSDVTLEIRHHCTSTLPSFSGIIFVDDISLVQL